MWKYDTRKYPCLRALESFSFNFPLFLLLFSRDFVGRTWTIFKAHLWIQAFFFPVSLKFSIIYSFDYLFFPQIKIFFNNEKIIFKSIFSEDVTSIVSSPHLHIPSSLKIPLSLSPSVSVKWMIVSIRVLFQPQKKGGWPLQGIFEVDELFFFDFLVVECVFQEMLK